MAGKLNFKPEKFTVRKSYKMFSIIYLKKA